jgi:ATP-dependent RNA helicase DDX3X
MNYNRPTPIQKYLILASLKRRDIMACAQTGSGKTAAYALPIVEKLLEEGPPVNGNINLNVSVPVALMLSPTRELALQIFEESRKFSFGTGILSCVVYGGADIRNQQRELNRGCDILIATPGRLIDLINKNNIILSHIKYLVIDEADKMLDMGFELQINEIIHKMPKNRETIMLSATFPKSIQTLSKSYLKKSYDSISIGKIGTVTDLVDQ